ncbi:EF-hand calcium-binding domain-containing protein 14 isoform X1 [Lepisosteus oculatus]|uniref:EF-hand calcium binding domain 14 n=1 Tax=Lepisosteus oculatus TaxID=7918 RepID=W5MPW2_LEPOC|nr:PREDICTED: EF-hand calcium-binding domain-containing protein 14 isoform X1 [Lepisosteus oculatus]XP_015211226.1 PREDICTED: EF-hand calcium-binding domain-containing protein 14 isoform X1 [Lepisosteus oculatus]
MKKRKELNALIGLGGDNKRKKTKKGSGHRLLRTEPPDSDSESSSDDEEFSNSSSSSAFAKRSYAQCCNICYPLCAFIILAACVVACAGLIWMQIALKEDLDLLKEKLHAMESSQKVSSQEIPKLNEDLLEKQKRLEDVENGEKGINKIWSNITEINKKIHVLDSAVTHLKGNIKSASDLINLPTTVEELQKSVATIGSTLTSVQHDVETMQTTLEEQKKTVDVLQNMVERENKQNKESSRTSSAAEQASSNYTSCLILKQEVLYLHDAISEVNASQVFYHLQSDEQMHSVNSTISNLTQRMFSLENYFLLFNITHPSRHNLSLMDTRVKELREKLQLIDAMKSKPDSDVPPDRKGENKESKQIYDDSGKMTSTEVPSDDSDTGKALDKEHPSDTTKIANSTHPKDSKEPDNQQLLNGNATKQKSEHITEDIGMISDKQSHVKGSLVEAAATMEIGKSAVDSTKGNSSNVSASNTTRLPRFLSRAVSRKETRSVTKRLLDLPGIHSLKDLDNVFLRLGKISDEGLSYDDLKAYFGSSTPEIQELETFDFDNNQKYSQAELMAAVGL